MLAIIFVLWHYITQLDSAVSVRQREASLTSPYGLHCNIHPYVYVYEFILYLHYYVWLLCAYHCCTMLNWLTFICTCICILRMCIWVEQTDIPRKAINTQLSLRKTQQNSNFTNYIISLFMCICICICICADIDMTTVFAANCQLVEETQHTLDSSQFAQLTIPQLRLNWKSHKSPSKDCHPTRHSTPLIEANWPINNPREIPGVNLKDKLLSNAVKFVHAWAAWLTHETLIGHWSGLFWKSIDLDKISHCYSIYS